MAAGSAPGEATQVGKQCVEMGELLQELGKSICAIGERISPILRAEDNLKTANETHEVLVPHAELLRKYNDKIADVIVQVNDICARVEL